MPRVGSGKGAKKFPYTPKGEAAAQSFGNKIGQPVVNTQKKGRKKAPRRMPVTDYGM